MGIMAVMSASLSGGSSGAMETGRLGPNDVLPDVARADAGLALVGEWTVPGGAQQRTIDAVADAWSRVGWPDGLLSHTALAGL
jgi:hypothetical protein